MFPHGWRVPPCAGAIRFPVRLSAENKRHCRAGREDLDCYLDHDRLGPGAAPRTNEVWIGKAGRSSALRDNRETVECRVSASEPEAGRFIPLITSTSSAVRDLLDRDVVLFVCAGTADPVHSYRKSASHQQTPRKSASGTPSVSAQWTNVRIADHTPGTAEIDPFQSEDACRVCRSVWTSSQSKMF
jgi:hypothetical protein